MLILDRIEGEIAYISLDEGMLCVDRGLLSSDAAEGDVLYVQNGQYVRDAIATQARREKIRQRLRERIHRSN